MVRQSDTKYQRERSVLFNDALNTFYLRLYGVRHMVKDHSDSEKGYSYQLTARVLLYAPSHRQDNTYHSLCCTSHGALAGTRNSSNKISLPSCPIVINDDQWRPVLPYFSFQPVLHDWCNKGCGMCYPVCGMMHIKEPLLLIGKSSLCGGSGFPFLLSEWSLTICLMPYNRK